MKFIYETETPEKRLTFEDCEINQFFVHEGSLYQKVDCKTVNRITNSDGKPFSDQDTFAWGCEIDRLIPIIKKIEY